MNGMSGHSGIGNPVTASWDPHMSRMEAGKAKTKLIL